MSETPSTEEQQSEKLFIEGYQVFYNEAGQTDSGNTCKPAEDSPSERDPDDLPVTFDVKTEPADPDYESSTSPAPTPSPATMPIMTLPPPRQRPQLKDVLPRLKQMQQVNASTPVNVIDELVKQNECLLAKNNTDDYKPYSRKSRNLGDTKRPENLMEANPQTFLVSPTSQARISRMKPRMGPKSKMARYGKILRPRSPTRKCSIPEKDKSHFNYALIESSVKDKSSDKIFKVQKHEMVCAVTCKAMFMTQEGAITGDFDLQFYWCNFCTFHTTNKAQLVQHGMEHRFHCKYCRYQSFSRADIIHHSAEEHADDFKEAANSMKYCILLSDYLQIYSQDTDEDRKKRAAPDDDEDDDNEPPHKVAKLEGRSVDSLSAEELKALQNDYQIFDMDVQTVEETDKNAVEEEPSPLVSASMNVPSDRQVIANSGLATYESPSAISNMGIAESCIQSAMLQNTMPNSTNYPTPVSLVAALSSRQAPPDGQFLIQNVSNSSVRPSGKSISSPVLSQRLKDTRPPPPPPVNKPKPGPAASVSSSLYWSCGYCSFTSHSQSEIKEHSQKSHRGKPHRYVALIMPSDKQSQNGQNADGAKDTNESSVSSKDIEIDRAEDLSDSVPMERESLSFKCFHCNFMVKRPDLIKRHLFAKHPSLSMVGVDTHSKRLKSIFYCPREDCPFQTKNPALYQSHVDRCKPCQQKDLNVPVEKHLIECLENTVKFSRAVQLKEQVSTHPGELSCFYCIFKSNLPSRVKHHVMTKHPHEKMVMWGQSSRKGRSCLIHFCSLCFWHTRIKSKRKMHMLTVHSIKNYDIFNGRIQIHAHDPFKMLKCTPAEKDNTEYVASQLEKENEEPELSDILSSIQDLSTSSSLLEEGYADHECDTIYRCLFCFEKCTGISAIKSHLEKVHPSQKMQAVNVEKCTNEEKCVFFLCPEKMCSHLYIKESLLIKHAQTHKSLCVSPTVVDSNDRTDTNTKTINDNSVKHTSKYVGAPLILQNAKVECSETRTKPALFSEQNHPNTDNRMMCSQVLKECTLNTTATAHVPAQVHLTSHTHPKAQVQGVDNSHQVPTVVHSISKTQSMPSIPISVDSMLHLGSTQHIPTAPLNSSITQNLSTISVGTHSTHNTLSAQLNSGNAQPIPAVTFASGNTQNISVLAAKLNVPLLVTQSTPTLMIPNVQSLQSVLRPCSGVRLALLRKHAPTSNPMQHLYQTAVTNSPLSVNISDLNVSYPLIVPPGTASSAAPTKLTSSTNVPNVSGLSPGASSGLFLAVIPPTSNIAAVDNTVHVEIVHVSEAEHGGKSSSSSSANSQHEVHKTQTSACTNVSQSDGEEGAQQLKIESVNSLAYDLDSVKEEITLKCDELETVDDAEMTTRSSNKAPDTKLLMKSVTVKSSDVKIEPSETNSNQSEIKEKTTLKQKIRKKVLKTRPVTKMVVRNASFDLKETKAEKKTEKADIKKFICKFCELSVHDGVLSIKAHITDNHPDEKFETYSSSEKEKTYFLCPSDDCTLYFPEESLLISHWKSSHEVEDETEAEKPSVSTKQSLKELPKKNKSPKSKKQGYECLYCADSYVADSLKSMKRHYNEQHAGQDMIMRDLQVGTLRNSRIVVCNHKDCSYTRDEAKDIRFQYHQLAHKHSRIFECSVCKWFSHSSSVATEHLLRHAKKRKPASLKEYSLKLEPDGNITLTAVK